MWSGSSASSASTACSRADLVPAEAKIEAFLTDLAIRGNVAAATQNQAMNALVFLYKRVLNQTLEDRINAVRADKKVNVPVVMTRDEVAAVLSLMTGTPQLVAKLPLPGGNTCPAAPLAALHQAFLAFAAALAVTRHSSCPYRRRGSGALASASPERAVPAAGQQSGTQGARRSGEKAV